jgi:hypothetical protein
MLKIKDIQHRIIYKDPYAYCAHPHAVALQNGDWLVVFNKTVRRSFILHPPEDPHYYNFLIRSHDQGSTWTAPRVVPGYDWYGVECAGLSPLSDGTILLNQWRFRWYPLETAKKLASKTEILFPKGWLDEVKLSGELETGNILPDNPEELTPWARRNGGTFVHRSLDHGYTWEETVEIETAPYSGGYGLRQAIELPSGEILLPLSDVPNYTTVFIARSRDFGRSWDKLVEAARAPGCCFEEPTALRLSTGRIIMLLRENNSHYLYQTISDDDGWTWSVPAQTAIWGYPAHLLQLTDGSVGCVYGYRAQPYGIRLVVSYDSCNSWDVKHILSIRDDLPNKNLGYPSSVLANNGSVFTVYYGEDVDGTTCIQGSRYSLEE